MGDVPRHVAGRHRHRRRRRWSAIAADRAVPPPPAARAGGRAGGVRCRGRAHTGGPAPLPGGAAGELRGQYFAEWKPLDFTSVVGGSLLVLIAVVVGPDGAPGHRSPLGPSIAFVGLTVGWALYSTRTVAVAAAMLVPITAHVYSGGPRPASPPGRRETGAVLALAAAFLAAAGRRRRRALRTSRRTSPRGRAPVDDLPAGTVVLNDWGQGGWMMWRWPEPRLRDPTGTATSSPTRSWTGTSALDATGPGWVTDVQRTGRGVRARSNRGRKLAYGLELDGLDGAAPQQGPGADGGAARLGRPVGARSRRPDRAVRG